MTSAPDLLVSLRSARRGKGNTSLSNVLGSNTFDLLVTIPVGVLIASSSVINFSQAVPMMFFLIVATILILAFLRRSLDLSRKEAWVLLLIYLLFILYLLAEVFFIKNGLI